MKSAASNQPDPIRAAEAVLQPRPGQPDHARQQASAQQENVKKTEGTAQKTGAIRAKPHGTGASETQATRIFDEANTQLGGPDSNERRSAMRHLRAAASAINAELRAGGAMRSAIDDQPYRQDLENAVHPGRPDRRDAPTAARPALLTLVAEQRIDPLPPIRPRRIPDSAAAPPKIPLDAASGFPDFARQSGASSLSDLLEAAAAYLVDVENIPQFSRPMLMQKLHEAHKGSLSREASLRAFAELLRQGKLQRRKGGQFSVTTATEFRDPA